MCTFCGQSPSDELPVVTGNSGSAICAECVAKCGRAFSRAAPERQLELSMTPLDIHEGLTASIIGQDKAMRRISTAVYSHYKKMQVLGSACAKKSNILLIGPSGSGKTMITESLARILGVPCIAADATTLTESGYAGEDVDSLIRKLAKACDYDASKASRGIIFLDEVDKLARRSSSGAVAKDVGGEGVQQSLLKLMEQSEVTVEVPYERRKGGAGAEITVNTKAILFICGGAFSGIEDIVARRLGAEAPPSPYGHVIREDLVRYGFIPEFIGRMPIMASLKALDEADLLRILGDRDHGVLAQHFSLFAGCGLKLDVTQCAREAIVKQAMQTGIGARGLMAITEDALHEALFEGVSRPEVNAVRITGEVVSGAEAPLLTAAGPDKAA